MPGAVSWRMRKPEYALRLDGETGYVQFPDSEEFRFDEGQSFTLAFWIRPTEPANNGSPLNKNYGSDGEHLPWYLFRYRDDDEINFMVRNSDDEDAQVSSGLSVYDGDKHHVSGVYDGESGEIRLYVDGELESSNTAPSGAYGYNEAPLEIGPHSGGKFPGDIDDVRIYSDKLTDEEIGELSEQSDVDRSLSAHYTFDGGQLVTPKVGSVTGELFGGFEWVDPLVGYRTIDDRLVDVEGVTRAYNRFAQEATAVLDDPDGTVAEEYSKPDRVELEVKRRTDTEWTRRFGGFVVNPQTEKERTKLELLSHDAWLRSRDVNRDFNNVKRRQVLKELVEELTPLEWVDGLVELHDNSEVSRKLRGEQLDEIIESLTKGSNDEYFGGTADMEFFCLPPTTSEADRDMVPGEYLDADFETDGKYELNEVTINYGGDPADKAVIVEERSRQRELGAGLDTDRNVVLSDSKTYTSIDTEDEAKERGREILDGATPILTGEITTWDAFDIDPGDLVFVDVPEQQVSGEFRVAEIVHTGWLDDKTKITLAENDDGVIDTLVELSDEVSRLDARAVSDNVTITRFSDFGLDFGVEIELEAVRRTVDGEQFTFGELRGGFGDGNGKLGDRRGNPEEIEL